MEIHTGKTLFCLTEDSQRDCRVEWSGKGIIPEPHHTKTGLKCYIA